MERIFDAHCHIYPPKIVDKAVRSVGNFYRIPMDMDGSIEALIAAGRRAGITNYLVHSVATKPQQVQPINEFISQQVKAHPDSFVGFGTLHPDSEDLEADVEHLMALGLHGVKLHPEFQKFAIDSEVSVKMCRLFEGKLPLLIHAGDPRYDCSNPENILRFVDKVPDMLLIGAHFGGWSNWKKAMKMLPGLPNFT